MDFFVGNAALEDNKKQALRLNKNSSIILNSDGEDGIQNMVRVAFAVFDDDGRNDFLADPHTILSSTTGTNRKIQDVAIWEPNASGDKVESDGKIIKYAAHNDYIIWNSNVTFSKYDKTKYNLPSANEKILEGQVVPTYALTAESEKAGTLEDMYNWGDTPAQGLIKQNTVQTPNTGIENDFIELKSVKDLNKNVTITSNKTVRIRMYIWLESQDIDGLKCRKFSDGMNINIELSRAD